MYKLPCPPIKYFLLILTLVISTHTGFAQATESLRCGALHLERNESIHSNKKNFSGLSSRSVVVIPVVVHVVWNSAEENIPDEQIHSQIEVLNRDFRAQNVEVPAIPSSFQSLVADVEFEFCLAKTDPEGNPTTGIVRSFTTNGVGIGGASEIHYSSQGGSDAWDTEKYLNIWVAKFAGGIGGIASFPGEGPDEEQGVEINYLQFGTINVEPPYHLGRTCTHEIGHFFNLEHPWGPQFDDCCEDDFVPDTPEACDTYLGECPNFPISSCSAPDMFMNFMFYTNDECMGMFTAGQKARMIDALNTHRAGFLSNAGCQSVSVKESSESVQLKILSNPFGKAFSFKIESSKNEVWNVSFFDIWGRLHFYEKINSNSVFQMDDISLVDGIYFLRAERDGMTLMEKVICH